MHTVLRAAAEKIKHVSVSTDDLHYFHFLNQVRNVAVAAVVCNKIKTDSTSTRLQHCIVCLHARNVKID